MLKVTNSNIIELTGIVKKFHDTKAVPPIRYDDYMRKALKDNLKMVKLSEPVQIKIPKSINYLLQRDFEPEEVITLTEYPLVEGIPFWTGESTKGVRINVGYQDGDSRLPCEILFSDTFIHGILVGATGMGKSVTLDAILYGILTQYPPWEVVVTMADAKIVSFKEYAGLDFPHIESIAATEDVDYLISVLEFKHAEMKKMNSVMVTSGTGASKIEDLRKFTGLCFPRNIIVIDEFQALFKGAGKKLPKLLGILDDFARLGRNTGYHLFLASQEIGGDLNKNMLNQIKIRMALGCSAAVSEQILGNDSARALKQKGRLLMNLEPTEANNRGYNSEFRVPYLAPDQKKMFNEVVKTLGELYKFKYPLNFYDENDVIYEHRFPEYIRTFPKNKNTIYLGEPCYFTKDEKKVLKVELKGKAQENFIILNHVESNQERFIKTFKENLAIHKDISHIVLYNDEDLYNATGLHELKGIKVEMRDTTNIYYESACSNVYFRRILCDVDAKAFTQKVSDETSEEVFNNLCKVDKTIDTVTNRARVFYILKELDTPGNKDYFGLGSLTKDNLTKSKNNLVYKILKTAVNYGFKDEQITRTKLPSNYVWILGLNKILGLGRDTKPKLQEQLKKVCQDSSLYNVRFILVTGTSAEMAFLKECARWVIMDETKSKDLRNVGAEDAYPKTLSKVLGVLYDKNIDECFKFKKLFLEGETLA